jgi:hypothetical protein
VSDAIDDFRALKDMRARERTVFGVKCPACIDCLPKAQPKVLLPGQICRAHKPFYRDLRPEPTPSEWETAMNGEA